MESSYSTVRLQVDLTERQNNNYFLFNKYLSIFKFGRYLLLDVALQQAFPKGSKASLINVECSLDKIATKLL